MSTPEIRAIEALRELIGLCAAGDVDESTEALGWGHAIQDAKAALAAVDTQPAYTEGHCAERKKPGGCQLHNLQCGYPQCDRRLVQPADAPKVYPAAQPADLVQEPVGEVVIGESGFTKGWTVVQWREDLPPIATGTKLYTAPPSPQRKPLTDEQIEDIWKAHVLPGFGEHQRFYSPILFARTIERAHGIGDPE